MKVVCFYTELKAVTEWSLAKYAPDCLFEDTSGDEYAYMRALKKYWTGDEELIVIEQDIEIDWATIRSLKDCKYSWCTFGYIYKPPPASQAQMFPTVRPLTEGLGCARFTPELQRVVPVPDAKWNHLDSRLRWHIKMYGKDLPQIKNENGGPVAHVHGTVKHHHFTDAG